MPYGWPENAGFKFGHLLMVANLEAMFNVSEPNVLETGFALVIRGNSFNWLELRSATGFGHRFRADLGCYACLQKVQHAVSQSTPSGTAQAA
jgi:hypothetical protein